MSRIDHAALLADISELEKQLSEKYNCAVVLKMLIRKQRIESIYDTINRLYIEKDDKSDPVKGLRCEKQHHLIVMYRHLFFLAAHEAQFSLMDVERFLGKDHATVLNGIRRARKAINKRDYRYLKNWNLIQKHLNSNK